MLPVDLPFGWDYRTDRTGGYVIAVPGGQVTQTGGISHRMTIANARKITVTIDWFAVPGAFPVETYLDDYTARVVDSVPDTSGRVHQRDVPEAQVASREVRYSIAEIDYLIRISMVPGRLYLLSVTTSRTVLVNFDPEIRAFFDSLTPFPGCPVPSLPPED
jgi:hypothetical protein